jgi:hypothetical protein
MVKETRHKPISQPPFNGRSEIAIFNDKQLDALDANKNVNPQLMVAKADAPPRPAKRATKADVQALEAREERKHAAQYKAALGSLQQEFNE